MGAGGDVLGGSIACGASTVGRYAYQACMPQALGGLACPLPASVWLPPGPALVQRALTDKLWPSTRKHRCDSMPLPSNQSLCAAPRCRCPAGPSEYVQGLTYEECATLLNVDVGNEQIMGDIFDTGGCFQESGERLSGQLRLCVLVALLGMFAGRVY